MTDTATRPLPTDMATLREYWLPAQPTSTVTAALAGVKRIDELSRAARARLAEHDDRARQRATELADAAIAGDDLDRLNVTLVEGGRDVLATAVDMLATARAVAAHRHAAAEQSDPVHRRWLEDCRRIVDEWQSAKRAEDSTTAMLAFMQRHNPR